jgi:hypothetical protein
MPPRSGRARWTGTVPDQSLGLQNPGGWSRVSPLPMRHQIT